MWCVCVRYVVCVVRVVSVCELDYFIRLPPLLLRVRGTGIRIEDDVLLTEEGAEVLNKGCPETVEELTAITAS